MQNIKQIKADLDKKKEKIKMISLEQESIKILLDGLNTIIETQKRSDVVIINTLKENFSNQRKFTLKIGVLILILCIIAIITIPLLLTITSIFS